MGSRAAVAQGAGATADRLDPCDDALRLINHVETTAAPIVDAAATPAIHQALKERDLLPGVHLIDAGYLEVPNIIADHEDYYSEAGVPQ